RGRTPVVEVGVAIPHMGPLAAPAFVVEFCRRAEAVGFDGLWTADHVVVPKAMASTYTLARRPVVIDSDALKAAMGLNLERFSRLGVAAGVKSRVRLGAGVMVLPSRSPLLNARQLASLDLYSGGRVTLGIGAGWLEEEATAMGMPWDRRGARTEEHIAVM